LGSFPWLPDPWVPKREEKRIKTREQNTIRKLGNPNKLFGSVFGPGYASHVCIPESEKVRDRLFVCVPEFAHIRLFVSDNNIFDLNSFQQQHVSIVIFVSNSISGSSYLSNNIFHEHIHETDTPHQIPNTQHHDPFLFGEGHPWRR